MDVFVFPGQGCQFIGMGHDLYKNFESARRVYNEVDDALSQRLSDVIFHGNIDDLNLTQNTQPALMTVSMAIVRILQEQGAFDICQKAQAVAGHSLGEYTALTAVNSLKLVDTARMLRIRGHAMQQAVPINQGGMTAILGITIDRAVELANYAAQNDVCEVANDNSTQQVVLSGHKDAIDRAILSAKDFGALRAVPLKVSAPFHCTLMQPAVDVMQNHLKTISFDKPCVPVVTNVTAQPVQDPQTLRSLLIDQITGRVRFRESIHCFKEMGATRIIEIGPGKVLTGLVKRTEPELQILNIENTTDIENFLKNL